MKMESSTIWMKTESGMKVDNMIKREDYLSTIQRCINCSPFYEENECIKLLIAIVIEDAVRSGIRLTGEDLLPLNTDHEERVYMIQ